MLIITDIYHIDVITWTPLSPNSTFGRGIHRLSVVSWYKRPIIQRFDDFVVFGRDKLLNKQSSSRWNETHWLSCDVTLWSNLSKMIYFDIYLCRYPGASLCCCFRVSVGNNCRLEQILITFFPNLCQHGLVSQSCFFGNIWNSNSLQVMIHLPLKTESCLSSLVWYIDYIRYIDYPMKHMCVLANLWCIVLSLYFGWYWTHLLILDSFACCIYTYSSELLHRHWGNHVMAPMPVKSNPWIYVQNRLLPAKHNKARTICMILGKRWVPSPD